MRRLQNVLPTVVLALLVPTIALAQDEGPQKPPAGVVRFRGGISAAGGALFGSGLTYGLGGFDARAGVQINDLVAVYGQFHGWFGNAGPCCDSGGITHTALVEFTLANRFFVAAGGGVALIDPFFWNVVGPVAHFRIGGYPLLWKAADGIRRTGLMMGIDTRIIVARNPGQAQEPMGEIVATIGYEAF
jgi:hypothetical protein